MSDSTATSASPAPISAPEPIGQLTVLLGSCCLVRPETAARAPDWKGAYALVIRLGSPVAVSIGQTEHLLGAGWYVYAGSAHGPGGVGARLRRHFRRDKKVHWHVDRLTIAAGDILAVALEGGSECKIVDRLIRSNDFIFPQDGFGSSDCRICRSHLLQWRRGI